MTTVTVRDESATGRELGLQRLTLPDSVTLRDLIRHRVREEVARHNLTEPSSFVRLVEPVEVEAALNGSRSRPTQPLDWERQADIALEGFTRNAFFVLVGHRQVEDLDEVLDLDDTDTIAFVRLVALVGG
jgi:hypothetical protein